MLQDLRVYKRVALRATAISISASKKYQVAGFGEGDRTSIGGFVDGKHKPTIKEISSALSGKAPLWDGLVDFLVKEHGVRGELAYGGAKYGWFLGFRKGGRPLADLYPGMNNFTVQVVLGRVATQAALSVRFGKHVQEVFDNARQLYDGRWLFVPVRSRRDLEDVKVLIDKKANSK